MEFRPCIDIHNGKVKQIVGSSLKDLGDEAEENFVARQDAAFFARLYRKQKIRGGHIILLNSRESAYYEATKEQALLALEAYPGGMQVGGGITAENAREFLEAGAAAVIVTSYVFRDGRIDYANLEKLHEVTGKERLVLDLSCRFRKDCEDEGYYIVTDRWQKFTEEKVTEELLDRLSAYCAEFLIHAVDVEGKSQGIEKPLVSLLGNWGRIPITYAGGIHSFEDLGMIKELGKGKLNATIGSALDLFGGPMSYEQAIEYIKEANA
ncbi:MAG: phosphoribosylformimino-5-aminoimidazole carboxamide ribotide isomerase [Lachnospiraceae bacterium]|nr:phosphoribosylformimino-5-aminoimidazole carboxamide ribotide isomerase [Lachnospiraceae bacterium]